MLCADVQNVFIYTILIKGEYILSKITVVDSIMGSGKTTWAIDFINENQEKNFLYITPYLDETNRLNEATNHRLIRPINKGSGKLDDISNLLQDQSDIASTHELFRRFDDKCKEALKLNDYILIVDETLTAVEPFVFKEKQDYEYLIKNNDIKIHSDGMVEWIGDDLKTRFDDVKILSQNHCLFKCDKGFFLWQYPADIFRLFKKIYILTYMFDGSLLKSYFDLHNFEYDTQSIAKTDDKYILVDYYTPDKSKLKNLIHIYDNADLNNNFVQKITNLSSTWFKDSRNNIKIEQIKNNMYNYVTQKIGVKSKDVMWTTYKHSERKLSRNGYAKGFISCNCRATNDYADKTCLMYALNCYPQVEIEKFFLNRNITLDRDKYATAEMLQWIWRSAIRKGQNINIYIPSHRMRGLLFDWLQN